MLMSVFCSLFISNSFAEGLTREQVKEELIEYRKSHPIQNEYFF